MKIFQFVIKDNISIHGRFYYALKMPVGLNPSAFGAEVAFYSKENDLLYHNKAALTHELNDPEDIEKGRACMEGTIPIHELPIKKDTRLRIASWSKQGNMVYLLEYFKFERKYYNVFLNLNDQYQIRTLDAISREKEYISIPAKTITSLGICKPNFDEEIVLDTLKALGLRNEEPLIKDPIKKNLLTAWLPSNKWHK